MPPLRLHWSLHVPVDRPTAWATFRNTDAFNRAAGLGFGFEEVPHGEGVRRQGHVRKFGLVIRWEEHPFELLAPDGFTSRRTFLGGPLASSTVTVRLHDAPDGTRVDYTVELQPRSVLVRPLVAADAKLTIRPTLDRALQRTVASLQEGGPSLDPAPPLPAEAEPHLTRGLAAIAHPGLRKALERRLRRGPYGTLFQIRPLQLAHQLDQPPGQVVAELLAATRAGLLQLRWELLCPRCKGAKDSLEQLAPRRTVHCSSCRIDYDGSFPDNVEVVFRPHPLVRDEPPPVDCLLSPHRTPQVIAQAELAPGDAVRWGATLQPGGYRVDVGHAAATLEVAADGAEHELVLDVDDDGVQPRRLRVAPGRRRIWVRHRGSQPRVVGLHRQWRPPFALSAGHLLQLPEARGLLPDGALPPGFVPTTTTLAVVAAQLAPDAPDHDALQRLLAEATVAQADEGRVVAAFATVGEALDALFAVPRRHLAVGLAHGPVVDLCDGTTHLLGGDGVDHALSAMHDAGAGRTLLHAQHRSQPHWSSALAERQAVAEAAATYAHAVVKVPHLDRAERHDTAQQLTALPVPRTVAGWTIGAVLAEGGQGVLHEASHGDGRRGAFKVLRAELATDTLACQRFRLEAALVEQIDDDAVVRVLDSGQLRDGRPWIVMERLEGHDLQQRLDERQRLPVPEVRAVGVRMCQGLDAAHREGVLHRDVKPANVFLVDGRADRAKLLDFGIAQPLEEARRDQPELILGTLEYMSPEQLEFEPIDVTSDVYAAALVLYESLSGHLPWEGDQPVQIAMQRLAKPPAPLDAPQPLAELILAALARSPEDRPRDARTLAEALSALDATHRDMP
jgi:hypothetical protein